MRGNLPTAPSTGTGVLSPAPNVRAEAMPVRQVYLSRSRSPAAKPSTHLLLRQTIFSSGATGCAKRSVFPQGRWGVPSEAYFHQGRWWWGGNPRPVGSIAGTPMKFIRRTVLFRRVEVQQRHLITSVKGVNHGLVSRNHRSQAKRGFFNAE